MCIVFAMLNHIVSVKCRPLYERVHIFLRTAPGMACYRPVAGNAEPVGEVTLAC